MKDHGMVLGWTSSHLVTLHSSPSHRSEGGIAITEEEKKNKLEINLTQNRLSQLQDLYYLTLFPQCRVRAFVYSKFQRLVHCKKGSVITTDSLLFQMSEHNSLLYVELHDNLFLILS